MDNQTRQKQVQVKECTPLEVIAVGAAVISAIAAIPQARKVIKDALK